MCRQAIAIHSLADGCASAAAAAAALPWPLLAPRGPGMQWVLTCLPVSLQAAMEAEAMPMVEALGLKADNPAVIPPPAPCHSFSGRHAGADVHVVCFGELSRFSVFLRCAHGSLRLGHCPKLLLLLLLQPCPAAARRCLPPLQAAAAPLAQTHSCLNCLCPPARRQVQGHWGGQCGHGARSADNIPCHPSLQARHCDQHRCALLACACNRRPCCAARGAGFLRLETVQVPFRMLLRCLHLLV